VERAGTDPARSYAPILSAAVFPVKSLWTFCATDKSIERAHADVSSDCFSAQISMMRRSLAVNRIRSVFSLRSLLSFRGRPRPFVLAMPQKYHNPPDQSINL
jgi:hypothetical protein